MGFELSDQGGAHIPCTGRQSKPSDHQEVPKTALKGKHGLVVSLKTPHPLAALVSHTDAE